MAVIRTYTKKELCSLYNISYYTLRKWTAAIKGLGEYAGGCYTIIQVKKIFNHIGEP